LNHRGWTIRIPPPFFSGLPIRSKEYDSGSEKIWIFTFEDVYYQDEG